MYLLNYFLNFKVLHFEFFEAWSNPRFFTCPIPWGRWNQYGFLCWFWNSLHLHHWIARLGTIRIPVARIKFRRGEKKSILLTIYCFVHPILRFWFLVNFGNEYLAHVIEQPNLRIPNPQYLELNFCFDFFNDSENTFWGFFEI